MKLSYKRRKQVVGIFDQMIVHYGISKHTTEYPELIIIHDNNVDYMGSFEDETEEIVLNLAKCRTLKDAVSTMIHEYCHYMQPRKGGWYNRYFKTYKYEDHPYEVAADAMAVRDLHLFMPEK